MSGQLTSSANPRRESVLCSQQSSTRGSKQAKPSQPNPIRASKQELRIAAASYIHGAWRIALRIAFVPASSRAAEPRTVKCKLCSVDSVDGGCSGDAQLKLEILQLHHGIISVLHRTRLEIASIVSSSPFCFRRHSFPPFPDLSPA